MTGILVYLRNCTTMTALYEQIIYGPVSSRRLGKSLGVNLLPLHSKLCSFDCIYCECGWNSEHPGNREFNSREEVRLALEQALKGFAQRSEGLDVITFAGNGEPTLHPDFPEIIQDTISLRDRYMPAARISVLSNATRIGIQGVREALAKVDNNILKIDSAIEQTIRLIDNPQGDYSLQRIVQWMKLFEGELTVQTMFLTGSVNGHRVDNTTEEEICAWLKLLEEIRPKSVMAYTIARDTPCQTLQKASRETLENIARRVRSLGIECSAF